MTEEWRNELPEAMRDAPWVKDAKSIEDAVEQMNNASSLIGSSVRVPNGEATDEQWGAFREKVLAKDKGLMRRPGDDAAEAEVFRALGTPEKPEDYTFDIDELAEADRDTFRALCHKHGLTQKQANGLVREEYGRLKAQRENAELDRAGRIEQLKQEVGPAWAQQVALAAAAAESLGEDQATIDAIVTGKNPAALKTFMAVARAIGTGTEGVQMGGQGHTPGVLTPTRTEAQEQMDAITSKMIGKKPSDFSPGEYERLIKKRNDLAAIAFAK